MATSVLDERKTRLVPRDSITGAPTTTVPDRYTGRGRYSGVVTPEKPTTLSKGYVNPSGE